MRLVLISEGVVYGLQWLKMRTLERCPHLRGCYVQASMKLSSFENVSQHSYCAGIYVYCAGPSVCVCVCVCMCVGGWGGGCICVHACVSAVRACVCY